MAAQLHIGTVGSSLQTRLGHLQWILLVSDSLLQLLNMLLLFNYRNEKSIIIHLKICCLEAQIFQNLSQSCMLLLKLTLIYGFNLENCLSMT